MKTRRDANMNAVLAILGKAPKVHPTRMDDEDFFAACASMRPSVALANDPRTKAFVRRMARRDASLYREEAY